jgi:gluconolactonase
MFAAPPIVKTEVFAELPERYRKRGEAPEWLRVQRRGLTMTSFLEGPCFDREGNLFLVDIPYGRIFRISPGGEFSVVAEYDGEPNGMQFHKDGRAFITDHKNGIMVLDVRTGHVEPYCTRAVLERFKGVNDLVFASNGDMYFTDQGQTGLHDPTGRLYRLRADGATLDCLLNAVPSPNGLVLAHEETTILLAVTRGNCVWRVPLLLSGTPSKVGIFLNLSGGIGPDGMAIDAKGNLAVCHPGMGVVWLFSPTGEPVARIQSCTGLMTTNCAYGGPDGRSLFITESDSGTILRAELATPGPLLFSHME